MHSYRVIFLMYIWSDGLYMIPDNRNILTCQSIDTNDGSRDPLYGPLTCNPATNANFHLPTTTFLHLYFNMTMNLKHLSRNNNISSMMWDVSSAYPVLCCTHFPNLTHTSWFNSRLLVQPSFSNPTPIFWFESSHVRVSLKIKRWIRGIL